MRSLKFAVAALVVALMSLAFGAARSSAGTGASVLVCGTMNSYDPDVQAKLVATGRFATVDRFDCHGGTPTTSELAAYDAVLVYSDSNYADGTALGNALADYADAGGNVVEAVFSFNSGSNYSLGGRWASGGYDVFASGSGAGGSNLSLVADVPSSPLLNGVSSFNGGGANFMDGVSLAPGSTQVAHWNDGTSTPLVAYNAYGVALNFYPPSSDARSDFWDASTDGATLLANALLFKSSTTTTASLPRIAVCTTRPVYRSGDGSYGSFADVAVNMWNAAKTDPSSPYFGATPAVYVQGFGLMCGPADLPTYGGDPSKLALQPYLVTEVGEAAPVGMDGAEAGAYYAYYAPAG